MFYKRSLDYRPIRMIPAVILALVLPSSASAAEFYNNKQLSLTIGFPPGGGFDAFGRTVARHMSKHIPSKPSIIVRNMPGAGSLVAANWLYAKAPKDGTVMGLIHGTATLEPLYRNKRAAFDVRKFNWIGSPSTEYGVAFTWGNSLTRTLADARRRETTVAGVSAGSAPDFLALLQNRVLGTKLKLVTGYSGTSEAALAIERGEVEGYAGWYWSSLIATKPAWLSEGKINLYLQLGLEPHPDMTKRGVPFILDEVETAEQKLIVETGLAFLSVGRPFLLPPGAPEAAVTLLRAAFTKTMSDPNFLHEARIQKLPIESPKSGATLSALLTKVYQAPPDVVDKLIALRMSGK